MKNGLLLGLLGCSFGLLGFSQQVCSESVKICIDRDPFALTISSELPTITNASPGQQLGTTSIEIVNALSETAVVYFKVNGADELSFLQGEIAITTQKEAHVYPLTSGIKGVTLQLGSRETAVIHSTFALSGEQMGNETQDHTFTYQYQFAASLTAEQAADVGQSQQANNLLPKTNERRSMLVKMGLLFMGVATVISSLYGLGKQTSE